MPGFGVNPAESWDDLSETGQQDNMKREKVMAMAKNVQFLPQSSMDVPRSISSRHGELWTVEFRKKLKGWQKNDLCTLGCSRKSLCPAVFLFIAPVEAQKTRNELSKRYLTFMKQTLLMQLDFLLTIDYWSHFGGRNTRTEIPKHIWDLLWNNLLSGVVNWSSIIPRSVFQ